MKVQFTFIVLFLVVTIPSYAQGVPRSDNDSKSKITLGKPRPDRVLVVKKTYSRKKYIFHERQYVWIEYRTLNGITPLSGFMTEIKDSSISIEGQEIPIQEIARIMVHRKGRGFLLTMGAASGTLALLLLHQDASSGVIAAYGIASVASIAAGLSLRRWTPIGDKYRISIEPI